MYALVFIVYLLENNKYRTEVSLDQTQMRSHLLKLFESNQRSGFPISSSKKSDSDSTNSDTSEQSRLDKHDVGNDRDKEERNYPEDVQFEDVKSGMWVLVFYEQENWLGNVLEKQEGQVK